jgi:site-specific recombinase XerD
MFCVWARDLQMRRRIPPRRLCTIAGFYRYSVEEDLLDHSPATQVRRRRLDYESHATGLDCKELGALLVTAGLGSAVEHALVWLPALNGLRVSEATGANIENLGIERAIALWSSRARRRGRHHPAVAGSGLLFGEWVVRCWCAGRWRTGRVAGRWSRVL